MQIYGLNKTTLLDYPGHVAATVFTGGCNFRCPFCHNAGLVLESGQQELLSEEMVLGHLRKRRGILTGVCITGGEPTLQPDLPGFISQIKELGYLVKLDTNGYRPQILRELLAGRLLDYVAMDIKAAPRNYARATGLGQPDLERIQESISLLQKDGVQYEFRTTVVKGLHTIEEFEEIGNWLSGSRAYYLQAYRESENILAGQERAMEMGAFDRAEMERMAALAGRYIERVELRGVE